MTVRAWASCVVAVVVGACLSGCNPYPLPGPLHYGKCGADAHTESYPLAHDERHAYGCKSDDNGFLEAGGQGDRPRN